MAVAVEDTIALPLAARLVDCLVDQFAVQPPPAMQRIGLRAGSAYSPLLGGAGNALVDEACDGIVWVRVTGITDATQGFPAGGPSATPCGPTQWAVGLEIGTGRCVPWMEDPNTTAPPTQDQWNESTVQMLTDAAAVRAAILCCFRPGLASLRLTWTSWQPTPYEVGNTGSLTQISVLTRGECGTMCG